MAIIYSGKNVTVDLKISSDENVAVDLTISSVKKRKLREIAIIYVLRQKTSSGENFATDLKISSVKNGNYVKSPSFTPVKDLVLRKRRRGPHNLLSETLQIPWKLREIAVKASFQNIWWDTRCSSGLFRTLYSVTKSEGKSGSSESK